MVLTAWHRHPRAHHPETGPLPKVLLGGFALVLGGSVIAMLTLELATKSDLAVGAKTKDVEDFIAGSDAG